MILPQDRPVSVGSDQTFDGDHLLPQHPLPTFESTAETIDNSKNPAVRSRGRIDLERSQRKAIGMKRQKRRNEPPILLENSQHRPQRKQFMFFSLRPLKIDPSPSKWATGFLELSNASAVGQIYRVTVGQGEVCPALW
jgi:hypothetical protein